MAAKEPRFTPISGQNREKVLWFLVIAVTDPVLPWIDPMDGKVFDQHFGVVPNRTPQFCRIGVSTESQCGSSVASNTIATAQCSQRVLTNRCGVETYPCTNGRPTGSTQHHCNDEHVACHVSAGPLRFAPPKRRKDEANPTSDGIHQSKKWESPIVWLSVWSCSRILNTNI